MVELFESRGVGDALLPAEREALKLSETEALPLREQLDWLRKNRCVGFWTTAFAAGLHFLVLAGGAFASLCFALGPLLLHGPLDRFELVFFSVSAVVLTGICIWLGPGLWRRLAELRRPLPSSRELGL